jgi:hypothetical protein
MMFASTTYISTRCCHIELLSVGHLSGLASYIKIIVKVNTNVNTNVQTRCLSGRPLFKPFRFVRALWMNCLLSSAELRCESCGCLICLALDGDALRC